MKRAIVIVAVALAGCQTAPTGYWYRGSLRVDANPALFDQFQRDRVICDGEAAAAALNSREKDLMIHNRNLNLIFDACLTRAGYVRRG